MNFLLQHRGELAALTAAAIWAISSAVYGQLGKQITPLTLNFTKGILAIGYLVITMLLTGEKLSIAPAQWWLFAPAPWWLLFLSGLVGIAWGDTFFFMALNSIGARLTLLINILSPVITALLASIYLQEHLALVNYLGIGLGVAGVAGVIFDRTQAEQPQQYWQGVGWAILSALANSIASICSRQAMLAGDLSPTVTTLVRLLAGTFGILLLMLWPKFGRKSSPVFDRPFSIWPNHLQLALPNRSMWLQLAVIAFFSTYLGIGLQQTALKYTAAGIAQTVGSTSPLFVLVYDWWQGAKISWRSICWAMVAIGGMSLLFR
jgi:drug/metabolite transporter (DMT)-like permease